MYSISEGTDAQAVILHTWRVQDGDFTPLNHMKFLHRAGFIKTAILEVCAFTPWLHRVIFAHLRKLPAPSEWPAPQPCRALAYRPFDPDTWLAACTGCCLPNCILSSQTRASLYVIPLVA